MLSGSPGLFELNLNGSGIENLPDDIAQSLPNLQTLHLNCEKLGCLPMSLGTIKSLQAVSIIGCKALLYPPESQRADPFKTARFLRSLHDSAETWRRLKVPP